jgi:hypothetical protein
MITRNGISVLYTAHHDNFGVVGVHSYWPGGNLNGVTVVAVVDTTMRRYQAYIAGLWDSASRSPDPAMVRHICSHGTKLAPAVAKAIFPGLTEFPWKGE